jgi:DNA-directed RNA polymerase specialized sigma24 family protein
MYPLEFQGKNGEEECKLPDQRFSSPLENAAQNDALAHTMRLIKTLPSHLSEVLLLVIQEVEHQKAANSLGISLTTFRGRLGMARRKLEKLLEGECPPYNAA